MERQMKREEGVLSIEAAIVVSYLALVIMLIMDIGHVYQAQNRVYHGLIQAADTAGAYSFEVNGVDATHTQNVIQEVNQLLELFGWKNATKKEQLSRSIKNEQVEKIARIAFENSFSSGESEADAALKAYGIADGLNGIDFSASEIKDGDFHLVATYKIDVILPVFGIKTVTLQQSTLAKLWAE